MVKTSDILGLNARSQLYSYKYNKPPGKRKATSKLATKRVLNKSGIPTPKMYAKFVNPGKISKFDWTSLPSSFALKPNKGLGGEELLL